MWFDLAFALTARFGVTSGVGQGLVVDPRIDYAVDRFTVEAELPIVIASVRQPAGSYVDTATHGNLVLAADWHAVEHVAFGMAIAPPLAGSGAHSAEALVTANSLVGYARPDAFTHAFAIAPRATFAYAVDRWELEASAHLPIVDGYVSAVFAARVGRALTRQLTLSISPQLVVPHTHPFARITLAVGAHAEFQIASDFADTFAIGATLVY